MSGRNRAEGWQHAKRTGHDNERLIAALTQTDAGVQKRLLDCAHLSGVSVTRVQYGGLCETDVACVLGGKTKSKTDMWLELSNGKRLNVSIKKEEAGQVFLVGIDRFIAGFEKQYQTTLSEEVKRALALYFGSAPDTLAIIQQYGLQNRELERRKHRLVAETLKAYNVNLYQTLLAWVNNAISLLFDFCFAKGLAANRQDWADIVWYKNLVGENQLDQMFYLPDIKHSVPATATYGTRNGGSTIQLPFGFVQWHSPRKVIPGQLQFHHSFAKLCQL